MNSDTDPIYRILEGPKHSRPSSLLTEHNKLQGQVDDLSTYLPSTLYMTISPLLRGTDGPFTVLFFRNQLMLGFQQSSSRLKCYSPTL